jgi:hypothetical protein
MSKVDALRAMREARYAANRARRPDPGAASPAAAADGPAKAPVKRVAAAAAKQEAPAASEPVEAGPAAEAQPAPAEELCGHRNLSGKSCRRPSGHPEKNHRYS